MTDTSITTTADTSVLAEFVGGASSDVEMMIGVGLIKDSDAVFFQYLGDEQTPRALMMPSGKPVYRFPNVHLAGISIVENIGEFKATKLNIFLKSSAGRIIMLTSGLQTIWSQTAVNGLFAFINSYPQDQSFTLDSWKGTSAMRPCFAAVKVNGDKIQDDEFKEQLLELKSDGDTKGMMTMVRDAVNAISEAIKVVEANVTDVTTSKVPF